MTIRRVESGSSRSQELWQAAWINHFEPEEATSSGGAVAKSSGDATAVSRANFEKKYYTDVQVQYSADVNPYKDLISTTNHKPQAEQSAKVSSNNPLKKLPFKDEMDDLFDGIKNIDSDQKILRLIFSRIQTQREHHNTSVLNTHHRITHERQYQKTKQKEEFEIHDQLDAANAAMATTATISTGLTIANIALIGVGILSAIFTAGATIPIIAGVAQGLVSVGNGVNTGMQMHYKDEANKQSAALEMTKHKRHVSHTNVKWNLKNNAEEQNRNSQLSALQKEVQKQAYKNTRYDPNAAAAEA